MLVLGRQKELPPSTWRGQEWLVLCGRTRRSSVAQPCTHAADFQSGSRSATFVRWVPRQPLWEAVPFSLPGNDLTVGKQVATQTPAGSRRASAPCKQGTTKLQVLQMALANSMSGSRPRRKAPSASRPHPACGVHPRTRRGLFDVVVLVPAVGEHPAFLSAWFCRESPYRSLLDKQRGRRGSRRPLGQSASEPINSVIARFGSSAVRVGTNRT